MNLSQVRQQLAESERKRLQDEKELSIIYDQTPVAMLLLDSEFRLRKVNTAAAAILAKPIEQALTLTLGEAFGCRHATAASQGCGYSPFCGACIFRRCVQDALLNGQAHRQVEAQLTGALSRKAASRYFLISTVRLEIENRPYALACLDDITERKQAEEKVHTQAAPLDLTLDAIHVGDLQGRIQFWNKGAEKLYGWTAAEVMAGAARDFLAADPASCRELTLHAGHWNGELEKRTRTGRKVVVQSQWTLLKNASGAPQSMLVVDTDITEKKQVEVQLLRAQRLESVGRLASGIAHDLNNILAPILMSMPLLRQGIHNPETLSIINTIEASAQRGASIVKQVLTFGRGGGGPRVPLQTAYLIKEMGRIIQETFPKSIAWEVQAPANLGLVLGCLLYTSDAADE